MMEKPSDETGEESLQKLLQMPDLVLMQFFQLPKIHQKIKNKFVVFLQYCQKNEDFCYNLIDIGIKCPMHEGSSQSMKRICYIASDILTSDNDSISDLFIKSNRMLQECSSQDEEQIYEDITNEEQVEVKSSEAEVKPPYDMPQQQKFHAKYRYLLRMLDYIKQQNIDQNCLNYLTKSLNCIIRKKINDLFILLIKIPELLTSLLNLTTYPCIAQFFTKLINEDYSKREYLQHKYSIVRRIRQQLRNDINSENFELKLEFIDQLFMSNRYAIPRERSELQCLSDCFVSEGEIHFYIESLMKLNDREVSNSVSYLLQVMKRVNIDEEKDMDSYDENKAVEYTLIFEIDEIFEKFYSIIISVSEFIHTTTVQPSIQLSTLKINFYELLSAICKNLKFREENCGDNGKKKMAIIQLIKVFFLEKGNGITKFYIQSIIQKILIMEINNEEEVKQQAKKGELINQLEQEQKVLKFSQQIQNNIHQISDVPPSSSMKLSIKIVSKLKVNESEENKVKQKTVAIAALKYEDWNEIFISFKRNLNENNFLNKISGENHKQWNMNENICFIHKLLMIFDNQSSLSYQKQNPNSPKTEQSLMITLFPNLDINRIHQIYATKLASSNFKQISSKPIEQFIFLTTNIKLHGTILQSKANRKLQSKKSINSDEDEQLIFVSPTKLAKAKNNGEIPLKINLKNLDEIIKQKKQKNRRLKQVIEKEESSMKEVPRQMQEFFVRHIAIY